MAINNCQITQNLTVDIKYFPDHPARSASGLWISFSFHPSCASFR